MAISSKASGCKNGSPPDNVIPFCSFKILIVFITCFCFHHNVLAGNLSLYASSTSVTIGGSIAITIKGSELAGRFSLTSSNASCPVKLFSAHFRK